MKAWALFLFFCAAQAAPAAQPIPEVHTLRKIVTIAGFGTRTYWAAGTRSAATQEILKVRQSDGTIKIYYLPDNYRPNDLFCQDIETPVVVTGTVTVRDGKSYLFPYTAVAQQ